MDTLDKLLMKMDIKQLAKLLLIISIVGIISVIIVIYFVISNAKKSQTIRENQNQTQNIESIQNQIPALDKLDIFKSNE
ncbi:MAG: hypothetical protein ACTTGJ_03780 [Clostridium sp.]